MKLTIAGRQIALPSDAKISIEKSSPMLNSDTGSFSYPFPVPTAPNQQALGWPGKLQRMGEILDQSFVLEDAGLQIFRGEVDQEVIITRVSVFSSRPFTKYIELTLPELLALQWGKRYTINGIVIILDKISFELPYAGKVEIEGYTA